MAVDTASGSRWVRHSGMVAFGVLSVGALAYILHYLHLDLVAGGNSWRQGDWLIHNLADPVRRGMFGSGLLAVAGALRVDPLTFLVWIQGGIVAAIFVVVAAATARLRWPPKLLLLLLSPAFVILFWFNDPYGSVRKEILVYLSFLPLIVAAVMAKGGVLACVSAIIVYAIAVFAHEGNVFFLPFLWVAMWLVLPERVSLAGKVAICAMPAGLAFAAGVYALMNTHVADTQAICAQLVQRGLSPQICGGAIEYLDTTPAESRTDPRRLISLDSRAFVLLYFVCMLSFRLLFQGSDRANLWMLAVLGSALAFVPLYLLAGDFGRWLSFHFTALVLAGFVYLLKYRPAWLYEAPRGLDFFALLALNLVIGISHSPGDLVDGVLVRFVQIIASVAA
jgi:hypothetical protein